MNRSILEKELKKAHVSFKGWVSLECDDCKEVWQPFNEAIGDNSPTAKLEFWRCPNNCNRGTVVSQELQTASPKYIMLRDIPGMVFGDEDLPQFERYVRSMDATEIPTGRNLI
jgi:hypothetical protein